MALLHDIQGELLDPKSVIGPILLKLRYLASKLGSAALEDWVKYETEGYPKGATVPEYRIANLTYTGSFTDGFRVINNTAIPEYIIRKAAGAKWLTYEIRDSIAVIDNLVASESPGNDCTFGISAGNLMPQLHGKVFEGMGMLNIQSRFAGTPFSRIQGMVRAKILDLTLELEKQIRIASTIVIGKEVGDFDDDVTGKTTKIVNNIILGSQTNIHNTASRGGSINVNVVAGDTLSLEQYLIERGVPKAEAQELTAIVAQEQPEGPDQPMGQKAKEWLQTAAWGAWDVTKDVGTQIIVEGLKSYYRLGG